VADAVALRLDILVATSARTPHQTPSLAHVRPQQQAADHYQPSPLLAAPGLGLGLAQLRQDVVTPDEGNRLGHRA
jgi:hypothetical protein